MALPLTQPLTQPLTHPDSIAALLADADFGAGNFLFKTAQRSSRRAQAFLSLERPYRTLAGQYLSELSLDDLLGAVTELASFYHEQGIEAKDVVGVYFDDSADYFIHFAALSSLGAVPALMNSHLAPEIVARYLQRIEAVGLFADRPRGERLGPWLADAGLDLTCWTQGEAAAPAGRLPRHFPYAHVANDPVLLTHTSGTTGLPKAVQAAHLPFLHGVKFRLANPMAHVTRYFMALPNAHNSAIAYLMEAVIRGCPCLVPARKDGPSFAAALGSYRPDFVIAFPKQLVDLCLLDLHRYDLSSVYFWRTTGDAVHERHVRVLTQFGQHEEQGRSAPGSVYIDGLGSSEMGSSLFTIFHTRHSRDFDRCIGKPQAWVDAQVIGDEGELLGVHQVGRLGIKSPSLTLGYWNNSNLSEKARVAGYWITGDLVYRDELGRFFHLDRITDSIATAAGTVYSLQSEELIMKKFDEVFECSVYACDGDGGGNGDGERASGAGQAGIAVTLAQHVAVRPDAQDLLVRINAWLGEHRMPPLAWLSIAGAGADAVPEGVTGKVLKRVLREDRVRGTGAQVAVAMAS